MSKYSPEFCNAMGDADEGVEQRIVNAKMATIEGGLALATGEFHHRARAAGWHSKPREFGTMIALIHSELSEALEAHRRDLMDDHLPHRKGVEVELADALIRIFDLAGSMGLDVAGAVVEKALYNERRADHKRAAREKEGGKKF